MRRVALFVAALLLPLSCAAQTLTVSAAASLADAMRQIGARFEAMRPGVTVRFNIAASGVLATQILHGAPVDVFASADLETMQRGIDARAIDAPSPIVFAANTLVMVVPQQAGTVPDTLAWLAQPAVRRIAVGKPATVPAGRYAQQALTSAGLWERLQSKLVFADNPRQALDYVARGEVDAGFVYRTDAALMPAKVRIALTAEGHAPVVYPAAVVAGSRQRVLAADFVRFLRGAEAQAILASHGFVGAP
jgi:molybdate transport system substrate-binding protein